MKKLLSLFLALLMCFALLPTVASAEEGINSAYTDYQNKVQAIEAKNPPRQTQLYRVDSNGNKESGICNVSAVTTLLNRRMAGDNRSGKFTVFNVFAANGCTNVIGPRTWNDSGSAATGYEYSGGTGSWNSKKYTNDSGYAYQASSISKSKVDSNMSNLGITSFNEYLAKLLRDHPEGVCLRNNTANHVAVITYYETTSSGYQFYVCDPVNNYKGKLEGSWLYKKSNKNLYNGLDFIVYLSSSATVTPTQYTVTLNTNGGSVSTSTISVIYGGSYGSLPEPTRTGYNFSGWYTASSGGYQVTATTMVSKASNHTLYARWAGKTYTVSFNANGGSVSMNSKPVTYGSTYGILPTPIRTNYKFEGWYTATSGGTRITENSSVSRASNHTLYAHWSQSTSNFDVNAIIDGRYTGSTEGYCTFDVYFDGRLVAENRTDFCEDVPIGTSYYVFTNQFATGYGWEGRLQGTYPVGQGKVTGNTEVIIELGKIVSRANFSCDLGLLSFDMYIDEQLVKNDTYSYDDEFSYGTTFRITDIVASPGFKYSGYRINYGVGEVYGTNGASPYVAGMITAEQEYDDLSITLLSSPIEADCYFKSEDILYDGDTAYVMYTGDACTPGIVVYDVDNDEIVDPRHYTIGYSNNIEPGTAYVTVYMKNGQNIQLPFEIRSSSVTVTFDPTGGSTTETSRTVTIGYGYGPLPQAKRTGYGWKGWYTEKSGGTKITGTTIVTNTKDHTLYAQWNAKKYTVTLDPNGGSVSPDSVTVTYDNTYGELPEPTMDKYAFVGWYTEPDGGTEITASTKVQTASDHTLYAHWEFDEIPIPFDGWIEWNDEDVEYRGSTPYVIANGCEQTPRFTVYDAHGNVMDEDYYIYEYRENVEAGTGYLFVTFIKKYYCTERAWFKIYLPPTTYTKVENVKDGIKITWDPVEGAAGYVIYRRAWSKTTNGWTAFDRWWNVTETTWTDGSDANHKVYAGSRYQYGVKAYFEQRVDPVSGATIGGNVGDNYNLGIVGPLRTTVRITTRTIKTATSYDTGKMRAEWDACSEATGYEVQLSMSSSFTSNVYTYDKKSTSIALSRMKSGVTYYIRVRAYTVFEGTTYYGQWSNKKSCKIQ